MADAIPMDPEPAIHPATAQLLRYFDHAHLPPHLQVVAAPFGELAHYVAEMLRLEGAEVTAGLRKILEAKDCVVRAALDVPAAALQQRASGGVPEGLVADMAHDRVAQRLTVELRIPDDGLPPEAVASLVAGQVTEQLRQRSVADRSRRR